LWLEDLISELEETGSCPVYPLLKREDEKYVTERAYENPRFVEDMIREGTLVLRKQSNLKGFAIECEAFESIHGHNAWAKHSEGSLEQN
jgi:GTP cyclohydrolase I